MAKVIYKGRSNTRVLEKGDFTKLGVEDVDFTKTEFNRNEPTEVSDSAAKAIMGNKAFGEFALHSDDTALIDATEADSAPAAKKSTASK